MIRLLPNEIEKKSFEIITQELNDKGPVVINGNTALEDTAENAPLINIIKRCIHTTADFDYAKTMCFSEGAPEHFWDLIKDGATIVTDTNMALSGINKSALSRYGCDIRCFMADEDVSREAAQRGVTRASVSMERAMDIDGPVIFVIGNAPTALITLREHIDRGSYQPAFVIGVPVGFVNVVSAKEMIMEAGIPFIVNSGQKGGSNVAAAIVNALLKGMPDTVQAENKNFRRGFTTGSCAAAAAKAAAIMLLEHSTIDSISITTPAGTVYDTILDNVMLTKDESGRSFATAAVRKPECDDPDITAGMLIYARAEFADEENADIIKAPVAGSDADAADFQTGAYYVNQNRKVIIKGGTGIGRITKPGLDRPVGDYAINSVPRKMIEHEVLSVMEEYDREGSMVITISAPEGEKIAEQTFNPKLGIEGGISIIGTSGVVEPMSTKAVLDTIRIQLRQKRAMGENIIVITPGNYGMNFLKETYDYDLDRAVKCSNYIGETLDMAVSFGFSKALLAGHIGKLIKVSGGIMNTHSKEADCRMELMAAAAAQAGANPDTIRHILGCVSTDEAYEIILKEHLEDGFSKHLMERIIRHLEKRSGSMKIECIVYSNRFGLIGKTEGAESILKELT